ncbi:roadblock/LC7 domain-containing protein [Actinokineospora sp. HUAS TT18]|uniref:roadblock/LC7 domain-containing protein n=1 Tax=Actinokineospora sp. HUAS TT18 TaxID=3447451 RepID=UPI003F526DE3
MTGTATNRNLDWLLDDLVQRVGAADRAVLLSADGLMIGKSGTLAQADAEHLAAVASAFQSLATGTGRHFGGGEVYQTVVEMQHAYLLVTAAGAGACLAVLAPQDADLGVIAYEVNRMVTRVGDYLTAAPRPVAPPAS